MQNMTSLVSITTTKELILSKNQNSKKPFFLHCTAPGTTRTPPSFTVAHGPGAFGKAPTPTIVLFASLALHHDCPRNVPARRLRERMVNLLLFKLFHSDLSTVNLIGYVLVLLEQVDIVADSYSSGGMFGFQESKRESERDANKRERK